jgi:hypothetical protein
MAAFWAEMGVAYLEMNKLQIRALTAHESQKGKSINVNY